MSNCGRLARGPNGTIAAEFDMSDYMMTFRFVLGRLIRNELSVGKRCYRPGLLSDTDVSQS